MAPLRPEHLADEFRASYKAAPNTPGRDGVERADLTRDALDGAAEAGVTIKDNAHIRRILYGGE